MNVLVLGLAKSGTTALVYRIRDSWPESVRPQFLFEPRSWKPEGSDPGRGVLAKVLIGPADYADYESFVGFCRVVMIVRDPRDTLISRLLYNLFEFPPETPERRIEEYVELIGRKVADPKAVNLMEICALMLRILFPANAEKPRYPAASTILDFAAGGARWQERVEAIFPQRFTIRYEDFVEGRVENLEAYLGFPLGGTSEVPPAHQRVTRSRASGEWQRWFNDQDYADFFSVLEPFLRQWDYPLTPPAPRAAISRETSLGYLERLRRQRHERTAKRSSP